MPQARDEAGNIWETDAQGNPVRLVQAAGGSAPMTFGAPDPTIARKEARASSADARSAAADARAAAAADRSAREFNATHNADGSPKDSATKLANIPAGAATGIQENLKTLRALDEAIASLKKRPQSIGTGTGALGDTFTQWNDPEGTGTRSAIGAVGAYKIHDLSGAAVSASEAPRFTPFVPTVTDRPEVAQQKLERFRAELQGQIRESADFYTPANGYRPYKTPGLDTALGGSEAQQRADNEVPGQANGAPLKAGTAPVDPGAMPPANSSGGGLPPAPGGGTPMTIATGANRSIGSDRLNAQVDAMMNAGASKAMIDTVLKQQGFPPISPSSYSAATAWMKKNPGEKYFGANVTRDEPNSLLAQAAANPAGSFTAQMADAATAGTVGALAGDKGRGALDAMDQTHPDASMAGSIIGGITGAGAAEAGIAARAPGALAQYAPRLADAVYGGLSGFNGAADGQGLQGAAMGAGLGVVGGAVGERAMNTAGSLVRGVRDPAVDYLRARGIPLTVGQIAGQGGALGRGVKKIEDALTSIPGVGNVIDARRREGVQGFNQAAFDIGAETTGNQVQDYGAAGLGQLRDAVGNAYDRALNPVRINAAEPQFGRDIGDVVSNIEGIPNVNGAHDAAMAGLRARVDGAIDPATDQMTGRNFQEAYRGLARTGRERANGDYGHEIGQAMRQGQDALAGALERQNPGAYQGFVDANQGNRRMNVLAQAVDAAKNQEDQLFTPAQLNRADAQSATRLTGRVNSATGNRPFAELAQAGQDVLPSKLPDSGTSTRAMTALALGSLGGGGVGALTGGTNGAQTGTGVGLGATLALMLGGTRGAQRAAERLLVDRPDLAIAIGNGLQRNARIGGGVGAGTSLGLGLQNLVAGE